MAMVRHQPGPLYENAVSARRRSIIVSDVQAYGMPPAYGPSPHTDSLRPMATLRGWRHFPERKCTTKVWGATILRGPPWKYRHDQTSASIIRIIKDKIVMNEDKCN